MIKRLRRWGGSGFTVGVAAAYLFSNVVAAYAQEQSLWSSRRFATQKFQGDAEGTASLGETAPRDVHQLLAQLPEAARLDLGGNPSPKSQPEKSIAGPFSPGPKMGDWLGKLVLPHGWVRHAYLSPNPSAPVVLHIQDGHGIEDVQRNIAAMIGLLADQPGVALVGLEGAAGPMDLAPYRDFSDASITQDIADFFLQKGLIAGPEYAGLTLPTPPSFFGAEDAALYAANVQALKVAYQSRPEALNHLESFNQAAEKLKSIHYSQDLKTFDRHFKAYNTDQETLGEYVRFLTQSLAPNANRPPVPNTKLVLQALEEEEALQFTRVEAERQRLIDRLAQKITPKTLNDLVAKSVDYRAGRLGYGDYNAHLRRICETHGIALAQFPQLTRYMRYVALAEKIERNPLIQELALLEQVVPESLAKTPQEKSLALLSRDLALLGKLLRLELSHADWTAYAARRADIAQMAGRLFELDPAQEALRDFPAADLKPFEDFCLLATRRNVALVDNLLGQMAGQKTAVLVAGGFHTDGLTSLLREKQISYLVVTPHIQQPAEPNGYLDVLAKDPLPLEHQLAGDRISLSKPIALSDPKSEGARLALGLQKVGQGISPAAPISGTHAVQRCLANEIHPRETIHLLDLSNGQGGLDLVPLPRSPLTALRGRVPARLTSLIARMKGALLPDPRPASQRPRVEVNMAGGLPAATKRSGGALTLESTYLRFGDTRLGAWVSRTFGDQVFRRTTQILAAPFLEANGLNRARDFVDRHPNRSPVERSIRLAAVYGIHALAAGVAFAVSFSLATVLLVPLVSVGGFTAVGLSGLALAPPAIAVASSLFAAVGLGYISTVPFHSLWNILATVLGMPGLTAEQDSIAIQVTAHTHASLSHPDRNEDTPFSFTLPTGESIIGLLDGMGGQGQGQKASQEASEIIKASLMKSFANGVNTNESTLAEEFRQTFKKANDALLKHGDQRGTTVVIAVTVPRPNGPMTYLASVGDSRAYLFRPRVGLIPITLDDHVTNGFVDVLTEPEDSDFGKKRSLQRLLSSVNKKIELKDNVEAFYAWRFRNLIVHCLGGGADQSPDQKRTKPGFYKVRLNPEDVLLLTSDGVHDNLTDREIAEHLSTGKTPDLAFNNIVNSSRVRSTQTDIERAKKDDISVLGFQWLGGKLTTVQVPRSGLDQARWNEWEESLKGLKIDDVIVSATGIDFVVKSIWEGGVTLSIQGVGDRNFTRDQLLESARTGRIQTIRKASTSPQGFEPDLEVFLNALHQLKLENPHFHSRVLKLIDAGARPTTTIKELFIFSKRGVLEPKDERAVLDLIPHFFQRPPTREQLVKIAQSFISNWEVYTPAMDWLFSRLERTPGEMERRAGGSLTLADTYTRFALTRWGGWIQRTFGEQVFRRTTQILAAPWIEANALIRARAFVDIHSNRSPQERTTRLVATYGIHALAAGVAFAVSFSLATAILVPLVSVGGFMAVGLPGPALAPPAFAVASSLLAAVGLGYISTIPSHSLWNTFVSPSPTLDRSISSQRPEGNRTAQDLMMEIQSLEQDIHDLVSLNERSNRTLNRANGRWARLLLPLKTFWDRRLEALRRESARRFGPNPTLTVLESQLEALRLEQDILNAGRPVLRDLTPFLAQARDQKSLRSRRPSEVAVYQLKGDGIEWALKRTRTTPDSKDLASEARALVRASAIPGVQRLDGVQLVSREPNGPIQEGTLLSEWVPGRPVDSIPSREDPARAMPVDERLTLFSDDHIQAFVKTVRSVMEAGIAIDASHAGKVLFDPLNGFTLIDLSFTGPSNAPVKYHPLEIELAARRYVALVLSAQSDKILGTQDDGLFHAASQLVHQAVAPLPRRQVPAAFIRAMRRGPAEAKQLLASLRQNILFFKARVRAAPAPIIENRPFETMAREALTETLLNGLDLGLRKKLNSDLKGTRVGKDYWSPFANLEDSVKLSLYEALSETPMYAIPPMVRDALTAAGYRAASSIGGATVRIVLADYSQWTPSDQDIMAAYLKGVKQYAGENKDFRLVVVVGGRDQKLWHKAMFAKALFEGFPPGSTSILVPGQEGVDSGVVDSNGVTDMALVDRWISSNRDRGLATGSRVIALNEAAVKNVESQLLIPIQTLTKEIEAAIQHLRLILTQA